MREILSSLNKRSISKYTDIPYDRLRKFTSGQIQKLTPREQNSIYLYLKSVTENFYEVMEK